MDIVDEWRKFNNDDWGMHATDTVDYDIILSGELWMELDDGVEVHLTPGDCVIQNGTRHAWRNRSTKNCIMLSVCIGANWRSIRNQALDHSGRKIHIAQRLCALRSFISSPFEKAQNAVSSPHPRRRWLHSSGHSPAFS